MKVKLKKISEAPSPLARSEMWENYKLGKDNGDISLPIEYELTGTQVDEPKIGESFVVNRDTRNGVKCLGIFVSSIIQDIKEENGIKFLETENSVYAIEEL